MTGPARYRKRPVVITALRVTDDVAHSVLQEFTDNQVRVDDGGNFAVYDRLHHTWISFDCGDYIIRGTVGEFYPCAGDVFANIYEPITDGGQH